MDEQIKILAVDDEESILEFLDMGFSREGYALITATTGPDGLERYRDSHPQLVILDWMLPGFDGLELCRRIRSLGDVPIIMLTARGDLEDKVQGFEQGADDYLAKPFRFKELLMRVKALLRRSGMTNSGNRIKFGNIELNSQERRVFNNGAEVELTSKEFDILEYFLKNPRQVLSREQILNKVWGWDYPGGANVVEVHVSALRNKLDDNERRIIRTVRGAGYALYC